MARNRNIEIPERLNKIIEYELFETASYEEQGVRYILKNCINNKYLTLTEIQYEVWENIDGAKYLKDIIYDIYNKFNILCVEYIESFIKQLCINGFIVNYNKKDSKEHKNILSIRFPIKKVNLYLEKAYQYAGKYFYHKSMLAAMVMVTIYGSLSFYFICKNPPYSDKNNLILIIILLIISLILHEGAHGTTCIHFGRKVNEAGFMIYMFIPVFYVDTTDIWMAQKKERILVSIAGPLIDLFFASLLAVFMPFIQKPVLYNSFYYIATLIYLRVLLNMNPLFKWDGYYFLMDIMGEYNLKRKSVLILKKKIIEKIKKKDKITIKEFLMAIYAITSTAYTLFFFIFLIRSSLNFFDSFTFWGLVKFLILLIILIPYFIVVIKKVIAKIKTMKLKSLKRESSKC